MGRQWLHAKRAVASLKKWQVTGKLVKEIMVAAKVGGPDPSSNARLAAAIEKARKESVARDVIERAIEKGDRFGEEKMSMEHLVFEGYCLRTRFPSLSRSIAITISAPRTKSARFFRKGQLGTCGSNKFLFDHIGFVEAYRPDVGVDIEAAAIGSRRERRRATHPSAE